MTPAEGRKNTADILCIGAQRAMTSWLHNLLSADPRCWVFPESAPLTSSNKEAHFWTRNRHRGIDWYRCLMTPPVRRDRYSLDFTPDYALLNDAQIAEAKALSPSAKVIYILRDPLARSISALRMHMMWDTNNAPVETTIMRLDQAMRDRAERAQIFRHADYAANIARWQRHFPDMILLNMEDLSSDPIGAATALQRELGLHPDELSPEQREEIAKRASRQVWQTPSYPVEDDLLHWLHGATWLARKNAESSTGLLFAESEALLKRAEPWVSA